MNTWQNELKALLTLTGPILITQLAQAGYGFIDTVMAGQVSARDLAAVAIGAGLWLPVFLLSCGIIMATTPLVAAAYGAGRHGEVPRLAHQALWLALLVGLLGMLLLTQADRLFPWLDVPTTLRPLTALYLQGIACGMPAITLFAALRYYSEALGHTRPVMVISLLGLLLNIPANAVFINGYLGLPALGGAGCGWATAVVMTSQCLALAVYVAKAPAYHAHRLFRSDRRVQPGLMAHIFRLGLPIGAAIFFEVSVFSLVAVLASPLGERVVAAHQISLSVTSLLFMLPLSLAISMTIRCGQAYGRHDLAGLRLVRRVGLTTTTLCACLSCLFIIGGRELITQVYSSDAGVRQLASHLLLFAAGYQIFDALQVGAAGCLRGVQDTRSAMYMTLVAYWLIALPLGYGLGMRPWWHGQLLGATGFWIGLVVGLGVACLLLNARLHQRLQYLAKRWTS